MKTGALSRRRFLMGATSLAFGAVAAGCGGGGGDDGDPENYLDRTYRRLDAGRDVAVSLTVDDEGLITYWTLQADEDNPFADFGLAFLGQDRRFDVTSDPDLGNVRTFGEFRRGDRVQGRTEDASNSAFGFNWEASRVGEPPDFPPNRAGSFEGFATIQGIDVGVLLGLSRDGNATFFGAFDDPTTADVDFYAFESLSIDRFGDGYDYFLNLYDDRIALRELGGTGLTLLYTFDPDDPELGEFAGQTFEVPLQRSRAQSRRSLRLPRAKAASPDGAGAPALRRVVRALRARETKRP